MGIIIKLLKNYVEAISYTTYILSATNNTITLQNGNYLAICVVCNPASSANTENFAGLYISNKTLVTSAGVFNGSYGVYAGVNPTISNGVLEFSISDKDTAIAKAACILIKL